MKMPYLGMKGVRCVATVRVALRFLAAAVAVLPVLCVARPLRAQTPTPSPWEDSLLSPDWRVRNGAMFYLTQQPETISRAGREHLIELLRRELDQTIPPPTADMLGDEESYGGYLGELTDLVARFNDPRATPYLIRGGIAYSMGARFQVAVAGDSAVDGLVATWTNALPFRAAVISTFGYMLQYADSTGHPLTAAHRATVQAYLLTAATDSAPWVRAAFVDAAGTVQDPVYVGTLQYLAAHDSATIDGDRYIAKAAAAAADKLAQRAADASPGQLLQSLGEQVQAACTVEWIGPGGTCQSLGAKATAAGQALVRGESAAARGQITALRSELAAQRGKHVSEIAFALLDTDAAYIETRLGQ